MKGTHLIKFKYFLAILLVIIILAAIAFPSEASGVSRTAYVLLAVFLIIASVGIYRIWNELSNMAGMILAEDTQELYSIISKTSFFMGAAYQEKMLDRMHSDMFFRTEERKLLLEIWSWYTQLPGFAVSSFYRALKNFPEEKFLEASAIHIFSSMGSADLKRLAIVLILRTYWNCWSHERALNFFNELKKLVEKMCIQAGWNDIQKKTIDLKVKEIKDEMDKF